VRPAAQRERRSGFTLLELVCVIAIIVVLASLLLGPVGRILQRVLADQWSERASFLLGDTVRRLHQRFGGDQDFGVVTLERIEAEGLLTPDQLRFLKDRRVIFVPFAGSDPDNKVVIQVQLKRGFWTERNSLTADKHELTRPPD